MPTEKKVLKKEKENLFVGVEDQATIAKAIASMHELSQDPDTNGINQLARWVSTKESHATSIQNVRAYHQAVNQPGASGRSLPTSQRTR